MNDCKEIILDRIYSNVRADFDVCGYAASVKAMFTEIFKEIKVEEGDSPREGISSLSIFYELDAMPGGSRADYIAFAVTKAFDGYTIVEISDRILRQTIDNIRKSAINPDREIKALQKLTN